MRSDESYYDDKNKKFKTTLLIGEITKSSKYLLAKMFQMERYLLALHTSAGHQFRKGNRNVVVFICNNPS